MLSSTVGGVKFLICYESYQRCKRDRERDSFPRRKLAEYDHFFPPLSIIGDRHD